MRSTDLAAGLLFTASILGCAGLDKSVAQPGPYEKSFGHVLLGDRNPAYPRLAPKPAEAPNGQRPTAANRRAMVAASDEPSGPRAPERADIRPESDPLSFGGPAADAASRTLPGDEPVTAALPLDAEPEHPSAPKQTEDVGLGDPAEGTGVALPAPPVGGGLQADTAALLPDFDPSVTAPDFTADDPPVGAAVADPPATGPRTAVPARIFPQPVAPRASTNGRAPLSAGPAADLAAGADPLDLPASGAPTAGPEGRDPRDVLGDGTVRGEVLAAAQRLLGVKTPFDEPRFLAHLLSAADLDLTADAGDAQVAIKGIYDSLDAGGRTFGAATAPEPGDLVFFSNTFDRDQDGRSDDWFTMAGVVETVQTSGTVTFIGVYLGEVRRMSFTPSRPSAERDTDGTALNSLLRERSLGDRPFTKYLAGELFASFGRLQDD